MKNRPRPFNRNRTSTLPRIELRRDRRATGARFAALLLGCIVALILSLETIRAAENLVPKTPSAPAQPEKTPRRKSHKKELSTIRLHLEVPKDSSGRNEEISVLRTSPIRLNVEKEPFLWELYLSESKVVSTEAGGPEIELQFNSQGRMLLESYTAANRGHKIAIGVEFEKERRWLAAPLITRLISNGTLRFTPDATLEEAERIVRGLNTIAEVKRKKDKF